MKLTVDEKILFSVSAWLDNLIVNYGEGFKQFQEKFYSNYDEQLGFNTFASTNKQWVYDSEKAFVPSGAYVDGIFKYFDSTFFPDFDNGRIIQQSVQGSQSVSGQYSRKELNVYLYNDAEREIILDQNFSQRALNTLTKSGVSPYVLQLPAIFPIITTSKNNPLQLGDTENKNNHINVRLLAFFDQSIYQNWIQSILRQQSNKCFRLLEPRQTPLNEYGNIKQSFQGSYKYNQLPSNVDLYVEDVQTQQVFNQQKQILPRNIKYSVIDIKILYMGKSI